jgi:hypothetical protein
MIPTPTPPGRCFTCGAALTPTTFSPCVWTCPRPECAAYYRLIEAKRQPGAKP